MILTFKTLGIAIAITLALSPLLVAAEKGESVGKLSSFNIYEKRVTLSGFSSGGCFAQMMQMSHSSLIHGIGVFSHTFYRCGPPTGKIDDYDKVCTTLFNQTGDQLYNPLKVLDDIKDYTAKGLIDNPLNLRNRFLYVYSGLRNFLFTADMSLGILKVYEPYIKNPNRIKTRVQDAELIMPSDNFGTPCDKRPDNTSFIGNCGLSGVFEALSFLHGNDHRIYRGSPSRQIASRLRTFDQSEFSAGLMNPQMDSIGYYYIPTNCERRKCILHFYFHGCLTGRQFEQTKHIENIGILELAEASDIIVVFPQAAASMPENDIGCWDTFGIGGELYATKKGDQITAVKRMLDRAMGGSSSLTTGGNAGKGNGGVWWEDVPLTSSSSSSSEWVSVRPGSGSGSSWSSSSYGHAHKNHRQGQRQQQRVDVKGWQNYKPRYRVGWGYYGGKQRG